MTRREMQIFFERTIQLVDPSLVAENKIPSDTIFQFIYASFIRYIKQNLGIVDNIESDTQIQKIHSDIYKHLISRQILSPTNNNNNISTFTLPSDYLFYIRSDSSVTQQYLDQEQKQSLTPNILIKEGDVQKIMPSYYNSPIILNPFVLLRNKELQVIYDNHTKMQALELYYIRKPEELQLTDDNATVEYTDMPENICTEVIEQAVNMFITEAKYRLSVKQPTSER